VCARRSATKSRSPSCRGGMVVRRILLRIPTTV
jgi:hypothetical protein